MDFEWIYHIPCPGTFSNCAHDDSVRTNSSFLCGGLLVSIDQRIPFDSNVLAIVRARKEPLHNSTVCFFRNFLPNHTSLLTTLLHLLFTDKRFDSAEVELQRYVRLCDSNTGRGQNRSHEHYLR
jgi:hypothetical protein